MCGIAGIIKTQVFIKADFINGFQTMKHRGPDHSGIYEDEQIIFGAHRLKIQDLSDEANQPATDITGEYVILFNGEIYNQFDIRKDLLQKGCIFKTQSDTEALLNGFIQYGEEILQRINGIYSFAIYHKPSGNLFLARDEFGVKPLYYYFKDALFGFSSELKFFSKIPWLNLNINHKIFTNYLQYLWSPGEETPYNYAFKLKPGNYITCNIYDVQNTLKIQQFFKIDFAGNRLSYQEKEWIHYLDITLQNVVERQLLSDVPVGFFASGGIDSSLIIAIAAEKIQNKKIRGFTIQSNSASDEGFSEDLPYAKEFCKSINADLHIADSKPDFWNFFDTMIYHLDEPQTDIAPMYVYLISKLARQHGIHVLLGGLGGDDVFSGYRRHEALYYEKLFHSLPPYIQKIPKMFSSENKTYSMAFSRRLTKFLKHIDLEKDERLVGYFEWFPVLNHLNIFSESMKEQIKQYNPKQLLFQELEQIKNEEDAINKMLYLEMRTFLVDHNLNYHDKMGMATGVEIRVPYLDKELVQLSTKIQTEFKLKGNQSKYILKKVAEKYLPASLINRSKTGFGGPVRKWVMNDWKPNILERIHDSSFENTHIFNKENVLQLMKQNEAGKIDASYTILSVLAITSWMKQFSSTAHTDS